MLAKVNSCAVIGLDAEMVNVEVDLSNGAPQFTVVLLPFAPKGPSSAGRLAAFP